MKSARHVQCCVAAGLWVQQDTESYIDMSSLAKLVSEQLMQGVLLQRRKLKLILFIFLYFIHFIIPFEKFGPPYLGKATEVARAALPSPINAC